MLSCLASGNSFAAYWGGNLVGTIRFNSQGASQFLSKSSNAQRWPAIGPSVILFSKMKKARLRMRLAVGIIVLAAATGTVALWMSSDTSNWYSMGVVVVLELAVLVFAWVGVILLRKRQRRRLTDMRDSALW